MYFFGKFRELFYPAVPTTCAFYHTLPFTLCLCLLPTPGFCQKVEKSHFLNLYATKSIFCAYQFLSQVSGMVTFLVLEIFFYIFFLNLTFRHYFLERF